MNILASKLYSLQTNNDYNKMEASLNDTILSKFKSAAIKVTAQRLIIYRIMLETPGHHTADSVFKLASPLLPGLSPTTVYNVLDMLVAHKLARRIKTDSDIMRYDVITETHHHLFADNDDHIEDYHDATLDDILKKYFETNKIPGFTINDIKLEIHGSFDPQSR